MTATSTVRAFVAVLLPQELQSLLRSTIGELRDSMPACTVRWVQQENVHLTLKFLGDVPQEDVPEIEKSLRDAVKECFAFPLKVGGFGCFPSARAPRVLWVGVTDVQQQLADLQGRLEQHVNMWGQPERREFHPHLTLGRVKTKRDAELKAIADIISKTPTAKAPCWDVDAIHLMQSVLTSERSHYSVLAKVPLQGCVEVIE